MKYKKIIIIVVILLSILIIGSIINSLIPKSYIKFMVAPNEVTVQIDSKSYKVKNNDTIKTSPGEHTITISQNEFESYMEDISIAKNETKNLTVVLIPLTDAASELLKDPLVQGPIESSSAKNRSDDLSTEKLYNPILSILPIEAKLYVISSCKSMRTPDDITKIALCIEYKQQTDISDNDFRASILEGIKTRGYNPDDYEIIWMNDVYQG